MIIYKATNLINDKIYIGLTTKSLEHRISVHKKDSKRLNTYFYQAIRKYGFENFKWEVVDTAITMEELEEKERYYIKLFIWIYSMVASHWKSILPQGYPYRRFRQPWWH